MITLRRQLVVATLMAVAVLTFGSAIVMVVLMALIAVTVVVAQVIAIVQQAYTSGDFEGAKDVLATDPERAIREAVWGMMPKGPLGRRVIKKLKIYRGTEHEHTAQKPRVLEIKN